MEMKRTGPNTTIIQTNGGDRIFFSYSEPVAAFIEGRGYFKSEKYFSNTTSGHVSKWLGDEGAKAQTVPHDVILKFAKEAR